MIKILLKACFSCLAIIFISNALAEPPKELPQQLQVEKIALNMKIDRRTIAVPLSTGEILFVGTSEVMLYNPTTKTTSQPEGQYGDSFLYAATLLPNDQVLIVKRGEIRLYDYARNEIKSPLDANSECSTDDIEIQRVASWAMQDKQVSYVVILLPSKQVLIVGNRVTMVYDPVKEKLSKIWKYEKDIKEHVATLLPNGQVLIVGSEGGATENHGVIMLYDPVEGGQIRIIDDCQYKKEYQHKVIPLPQNQVLIISHGQTWLYDARAETGKQIWKFNAELHNGVGELDGMGPNTVTLLKNGQVLIIGTGKIACYNSVTRQVLPVNFDAGVDWEKVNTNKHTATLLRDDRVLVVLQSGIMMYNPDGGILSWLVQKYIGMHIAELLPSEQVLIATEKNGTQLFDPYANQLTWHNEQLRFLSITLGVLNIGPEPMKILQNGQAIINNGKGYYQLFIPKVTLKTITIEPVIELNMFQQQLTGAQKMFALQTPLASHIIKAIGVYEVDGVERKCDITKFATIKIIDEAKDQLKIKDQSQNQPSVIASFGGQKSNKIHVSRFYCFKRMNTNACKKYAYKQLFDRSNQLINIKFSKLDQGNNTISINSGLDTASSNEVAWLAGLTEYAQTQKAEYCENYHDDELSESINQQELLYNTCTDDNIQEPSLPLAV